MDASNKERAVAEFKAWALESSDPALVRAVREGYSIESGVLRRISDSIIADTKDAMLFHEPLPSGFSREDRKDPRERSFAAHDKVVTRALSVPRPPCVEIEVEPIQRVRLGVRRPWFTAIVVTVESPITAPRIIVIPTE